MTCAFSSQHFSSYPATSRSDVPSLCPAGATARVAARWRNGPARGVTVLLLPLARPVGPQRARRTGWADWPDLMRATGARQVRISSAANSQRCLRSCMRAVVRPCCCTSCCTEMTCCKSQSSMVKLPPDPLSQLALTSLSRSQVAAWAASAAVPLVCGTTIRACPLASTAVGSDCHSFRHSVARKRTMTDGRPPIRFRSLRSWSGDLHLTQRAQVSSQITRGT